MTVHEEYNYTHTLYDKELYLVLSVNFCPILNKEFCNFILIILTCKNETCTSILFDNRKLNTVALSVTTGHEYLSLLNINSGTILK